MGNVLSFAAPLKAECTLKRRSHNLLHHYGFFPAQKPLGTSYYRNFGFPVNSHGCRDEKVMRIFL